MITLRFYRDMFDKVEWDYYNNLADAANNTNTAEPITNTVDHQKKKQETSAKNKIKLSAAATEKTKYK